MVRRFAPGVTTLLVCLPMALLGAVSASADSVMPTGALIGLSGRYALPAQTPTQLVVFGHGHQNSSASWVSHLREAANRGAVAVAPDYRGTGPGPVYYGWPAKNGAEDLVTVAKFFLNRCPTIKQVYLLGVSMGGNMSGLALAGKPLRADGKPLFDYWVDVEGVNNLAEEYLLARGVAPVNAGGAVAQAEIEAETGGPIESKPAEYQSRSNVFRAQDIAASGIKGAVLVQAIEDGLVPYDQSLEMTTALRATGMPTDLYSVLRRDPQQRDPGAEQTTILGTVPGFGPMDPFAGHGWEGSNTHIVIRTGLDRLYALMDATTARPSNANFLVDSGLGTLPSSDTTTAKSPAGAGSSPCSTASADAANGRAVDISSAAGSQGTLGVGSLAALPLTSTGTPASDGHGIAYLAGAILSVAVALMPRRRKGRRSG
jgi:pimeloyl-ACP methyl ester carboxylesterase